MSSVVKNFPGNCRAAVFRDSRDSAAFGEGPALGEYPQSSGSTLLHLIFKTAKDHKERKEPGRFFSCVLLRGTLESQTRNTGFKKLAVLQIS